MAVLATGSLLAQNRQVSGVVSAEDGEPIAGATVTVQGTNTVAVTNAGGAYNVSAPADGTLVIAFLGMNDAQVAIGNRSTVNVTLTASAEAIEDVIVVAFGTTTKEAFTGSATVMNAADIEKRQTSNILNALVGSVPGLQLRGSKGQPGSDDVGDINIRGISSMFADTAPLIIVDGAPYPASLSNIPQSDIESVTVLKDAASAALYGARAASGVIIVTTKRAKSQEAVVSVDMKWGVNSRAMQLYDVITDPGEYYEAYYAQVFNRDYYNANAMGQAVSPEAANASANRLMLDALGYDVFSRPEGQALIGLDGKLNPSASLGRKYSFNDKDYWLTGDDWMKATYKTNLRQEYNVSINGGSERASIYASASYLNDGGIVDNTNFERMAARLKADFQAKKWLKIGANVGYTHSLRDENANWGTSGGTNNIFYFASNLAPIYPLYVRDANKNIMTDEFGNKMYDYGMAAAGGYEGLSRPFGPGGNPLGENQYNEYQVGTDMLNGTFNVEVNFTDFLRASVTSTLTWQQDNTHQMGNMYYGTPAATNGWIEKEGERSYRTDNVQTLTYFDKFGKHNINAMIGHEYYNSTVSNLMARGRGMFSPDIQEIDATATPNFNAESRSEMYNVEGYFFSGQYDYDNKYYGSVFYRMDGTSRFAPENRWGNFWGISGAWIMSKENFMSNVSWVDMLKLKASVGQVGNDRIPDYSYIDRFDVIDSGDGIHMSAVPVTKGNRDITWETTTSYNFGVEFTLWRGRLSGSLDVYNKKTTDLLFSISISESSGFRNMYQNIGDMRNTGFELVLNGSIIRTRNLDWSIGANLTLNRDKILSLPEAKTMGRGGFDQSDATRFLNMWYKEGGSLYNPYLPEFAGLNDHGQPLYYMDVEQDGKIIRKGGTTTDFNWATSNAPYEQGSMLPKFYGGFSTSLTYKNLDFSAQFDYSVGGKVYDAYYASTVASGQDANGGSAIHKDWVKSWSPTNTSGKLPRWQLGDIGNDQRSSLYLTDASYLNFQSFTIGYTIPEKWLKDFRIRVYVAGENLVFWSARKGLDPRYAFIGNTSVLDYSPIRTVSGGVSLTF